MKAGDTFGDYRVLRLLGKGGMGEVWLLEGKMGGLVAAKILDPSSAGEHEHEARRRFLREAELALGVKHPNLVETYDVGEDPETGLCYILMEYVPGGTLSSRLKKHGPLAVEEAVAVISAIAGVLELGRRKGIVHRDIKPANIMFDGAGTPKLADLGIARAEAEAETSVVTQTGVMIGTPAYMSPEQMLDSHHVDSRADIYSLGIVFFEILTGERPNRNLTPVQLMAKAIGGEPIPDVRTLRPDVPASLAGLIVHMTAPNREHRIATPAQVKNALAGIMRGGKFKEEVPPAPQQAASTKRTHPIRVLLLFFCLIVSALAGVYLYRQGQVPSAPHQNVETVVSNAKKNVDGALEDEEKEKVDEERRKKEELERAARIEQERRAEQERRKKAELERRKKAEQERREKVEQERQRQAERERQKQAELERQRQAEIKWLKQAELERRKQAESELQKKMAEQEKAEQERRQKEEINRHQRDEPKRNLDEEVKHEIEEIQKELHKPPQHVQKQNPEPPSKSRADTAIVSREIVPYFPRVFGGRRYPTDIDVEIRGNASVTVEKRQNENGGVSAVVSSRGAQRGIFLLKIRAEGKEQIVPVQLSAQSSDPREIDMERIVK